MKNLLYIIGGYEPQIVNAGRLGVKFMLPGLSLFIVLITSSYGGYHLADTITSGWSCIFITLGFVSLILLVDFLLLHGEKSLVTGGMRVLLSLTMGFIISLLTCLVLFESDIKAKSVRDMDMEVKAATATRERDIAYWKTLPDSIIKYNNLAVIAHKGSYVTERGETVGKCKDLDQSMCPEGTYCKDFKNRADYFKNIYDDNKHLITDTSHLIKAQGTVKDKNSEGIIEQIKDLWALMMAEGVVLFGVILFFIFLMVIDLMPISVKFGIKDSLDKKYEDTLETLKKEANLFDMKKEKTFMENAIERARIKEEKDRKIKELERLRETREKLEAIKKDYVNSKLQQISDRLQNRTSQVENETEFENETKEFESDTRFEEEIGIALSTALINYNEKDEQS